ncbi:MAG: Outer membrane protein assembly factor BamA [Bacteroidetes bacterium ADurb.Bin008]|nr:MAG: Outer membrane protein assembly factor BamA [Bacteroidetes bacterium ADurb.Bin008]
MPLIFSNIWNNCFPARIPLLLVVGIALLLTSCSITRRVPDDKYLLDKVNVKIETAEKVDIKTGELQKYIRQKPNKRILLFRFYLRLYNAAKPHKYTGISRWLKTIGEEPVILDSTQTQRTSVNLKKYLDSKGYYNSLVSDNTEYGNKKATVSYTIKPGLPYKVKNINYVIEDPDIRQIVLNDTCNSILSKGKNFDMDLLQDERTRIEKLLKEEGYYFFSHDYITFNADTNLTGKQVDLDLNIRNRFIRDQFGERILQPYKKYEINKVYFYPNYDPVKYYQYQQYKLLDTVRFDNQYFIFHKDPGIRFKTLINSNLIKPGNLYSESTVKNTKSKLTSLRLYRVTNISFEEQMDDHDDGFDAMDFVFFNQDQKTEKVKEYGHLNCHIQLTPHTLQSYQFEFVGTNSASDIGVEGNFNYQHKNIFRGAESFDIKLRGMVEILSSERTGFDNAVEYGGAVSFGFPRFLGPQYFQKILNQYNPRTQISVSYNYQHRPQYTRTVAGLNFGYTWRSEKKFSHTIIPTEINLINIFAISPSFWDIIRDTYLENSYISQLVPITSYSMIYNSQVNPRDNYSIVRFNLELSGNLLNSAFSLWGKKEEDDTYKIFNISFSQFVRSDINYTFNHIVDENNKFVYRVYAGAGLPYGNSKALPFEKKYFSGGSTGIRAWTARGLGPGSYVEPQRPNKTPPNQTADIKLEANAEYRFKVIWMIEGAIFVDAGNIWAISSADERPGALFKPNEFYKQIALGTGFGMRMDLSFFVLRFDLGIKIHDPGIDLSNVDGQKIVHWIPFNRRYTLADFGLNFGIGYPF